MKERKNAPHINPKTGKECFGFKYKREAFGRVACLSCDWVSDNIREEDKNLPTLSDIKDN
jgi:hypothetical protein